MTYYYATVRCLCRFRIAFGMSSDCRGGSGGGDYLSCSHFASDTSKDHWQSTFLLTIPMRQRIGSNDRFGCFSASKYAAAAAEAVIVVILHKIVLLRNEINQCANTCMRLNIANTLQLVFQAVENRQSKQFSKWLKRQHITCFNLTTTDLRKRKKLQKKSVCARIAQLKAAILNGQ